MRSGPEIPHTARILALPAGPAVLRIGRHHTADEASRDGPLPDLPDTWGFNAVLAGSGICVDAQGRNWSLAPGDAFLRVPGVPQRTRMSAGYGECYLSLDADTARRCAGLGLVPMAPAVLPQAWSPTAARQFDHLAGLMADHRSDAAALLRQALTTIAACRLPQEAPEDDASLGARAQAWMRAHLAERFTLEELASACGIGVESLRKRFRAEVGTSPLRWAIRQRLEQAFALLAHHPVAEVARRLGYPDAATFSEQFSHHLGKPPSAAQRQTRGSMRPHVLKS